MNAYASPKLIWTIIGAAFAFVSIIAITPEPYEVYKNRTNFGLSPLFTFADHISMWLLVQNFLCLNYHELVGIFQHDFSETFPTLIVFVEFIGQWISFMPTVFMMLHYDDREHNKFNTPSKKFISKLINNGLVILNITIVITMLMVWLIVGIVNSFECAFINYYGQVCGFVSTLLVFIQYVPQFIVTIKIRDNGSLSLLMLEILGPTEIMNGIYMAVVLKEGWSTYLASFAEGAFQLTLLLLCALFKLYNKIKKPEPNFPDLSSTVLSPIIPVNIP
ncbi:hypothetical protein TVAG_139440 [Trichomonas vaginalis G3]|uniref:PQ loop repeat family protein n=1 Tax=Trichomonas vaginalis (strain ATCC PRA-98 / G3) TaxID=412133 RepID=A2GCQ5_TRIV3|nr:PQ loop repeat-containing protein [Trichomonas vaginalis G3]EAX85064.1 hypothetical protein TVAG_139440 [Trichomonas vaginalis G3]KAI5495184.1 PQ loop repeat-containing protein [Trichomonas vaginalis G3]|eukprot:XP_001297994.1 hypothetical protein [Trichomonas vaginalis G3]